MLFFFSATRLRCFFNATMLQGSEGRAVLQTNTRSWATRRPRSPGRSCSSRGTGGSVDRPGPKTSCGALGAAFQTPPPTTARHLTVKFDSQISQTGRTLKKIGQRWAKSNNIVQHWQMFVNTLSRRLSNICETFEFRAVQKHLNRIDFKNAAKWVF